MVCRREKKKEEREERILQQRERKAARDPKAASGLGSGSGSRSQPEKVKVKEYMVSRATAERWKVENACAAWRMEGKCNLQWCRYARDHTEENKGKDANK